MSATGRNAICTHLMTDIILNSRPPSGSLVSSSSSHVKVCRPGAKSVRIVANRPILLSHKSIEAQEFWGDGHLRAAIIPPASDLDRSIPLFAYPALDCPQPKRLATQGIHLDYPEICLQLEADSSTRSTSHKIRLVQMVGMNPILPAFITSRSEVVSRLVRSGRETNRMEWRWTRVQIRVPTSENGETRHCAVFRRGVKHSGH